MPPSNCFETGRRSQTQSSVRPCGAETANGCLVLDRRGITAERREGELERPEDFVSAPPERVRRAFAFLTRTYHGGLVLDRRGITAERREGELERPEDFVSAPPERVRRAFALLTRTYHGRPANTAPSAPCRPRKPAPTLRSRPARTAKAFRSEAERRSGRGSLQSPVAPRSPSAFPWPAPAAGWPGSRRRSGGPPRWWPSTPTAVSKARAGNTTALATRAKRLSST